MLHVPFNRPTQAFKCYGGDGAFAHAFEANGDAYGKGQIPPGHYLLTEIDDLRTNANPQGTVAEGAFQVWVVDMDPTSVHALITAGKAEWVGSDLSIGGIVLPVGELQKTGRDEIMCHGGGTDLGVPACWAPNQALCKTLGCTRLHNADLATLVEWLRANPGQHVVFSVVGYSPALPF